MPMLPIQSVILLTLSLIAIAQTTPPHASSPAPVPSPSNLPPNLKPVQEVMGKLKKLLDGLDYAGGMKEFFGKGYGENVCDANKYSHRSRADVVDAINEFKISAQQRLALRLFYVGDELDKGNIEALLGEQGKELLNALLQQKLLVEKEGKYHMNDLCLDSYPLKHSKPEGPLYLFSDISKKWSHSEKEPTDRITVTSLSLLKAIEKRQGERGAIEGVGADLGSGGGIQALALLRMNPKLKMIGVEIEPHSIQLSLLNAALNGVSDNFTAINNQDSSIDGKSDALKKELNGRKLSIAVSNPPFNLVPESLGKDFTKYGYGGPDGLAVTELLMRQAVSNLDEKGEMIVYSQFGIDKNGEPLFSNMLTNKIRPNGQVEVSYEEDPMEHLGYGIHVRNVEDYSKSMVSWLSEQSPRPAQLPTPEQFQKALNEAGVKELAPMVAVIKSTPGNKEYSFKRSIITLNDPTKLKGGIREEMREIKGGVYVQQHKVIDLKEAFINSKAEDMERLFEIILEKDMRFKNQLTPIVKEKFQLSYPDFVSKFKSDSKEERIKKIKALQEELKKETKK